MKKKRLPQKREWTDVQFDNVSITDITLKNKYECDPKFNPKRCRLGTLDCATCKGLNYHCIHLKEATPVYEDDKIVTTIPANEKSEEGYCVKGRELACHPKLGRLIFAKVNKQEENFYLICKCKYPGLYDKHDLLSDCTRPVRCTITNIDTASDILNFGKCQCPAKYKSVINGFDGPRCIKRKIREDVSRTDFSFANSGYLNVENVKKYLDPAFYNNLPFLDDYKIRNPCQWQDDNYLPSNKIITYKNNSCCECLPTQGYYPVYSNDSILKSDFTHLLGRKNYPTGCRSIYSDKQPRDTEVIEETLFYRNKEGPVTVWRFKNLDRNLIDPQLIEEAKNEVTIQVRWPVTLLNIHYSYYKDEIYFRKYELRCRPAATFIEPFVQRYKCDYVMDRMNTPITVGTRMLKCHDIIKKQYYMPYSSHAIIQDMENLNHTARHNAAIVCKMPTEEEGEKFNSEKDKKYRIDPMYYDTIVMNPYIMHPYFDVNGAIVASNVFKEIHLDRDVSFLVTFNPISKMVEFSNYDSLFDVADRSNKCVKVPFNLCG